MYDLKDLFIECATQFVMKQVSPVDSRIGCIDFLIRGC